LVYSQLTPIISNVITIIKLYNNINHPFIYEGLKDENIKKSMGPGITSLQGAKEENKTVWIPVKSTAISCGLIIPDT
jgi:hypothetical protein